MKNTKYLAALAIVTSIGFAGTGIASAATTPKETPQGWMRGGMMKNRGEFGIVTAVNGPTITINTKNPKSTANIVYTIDARNATVTKSGTASSVSAIAVGDTIMVQGTLNGTTITATKIFDGILKQKEDTKNKPLPFTGNGQPVVAGSITAINGTTITITNKSNVTYTIDATNAKILKGGTTNPTIANLAAGDTVVVQGTVNGTTVAAATLIDQSVQADTSHESTKGVSHRGFFGKVGGFFSHFFGL